MKIKTVTFDFWNTTFDSSNGSNRNAYRYNFFLQETAKLGFKISESEFHQALNKSWMFFDKIWKTELRTPNSVEMLEYLWNHLSLPKYEDKIEEIAEFFDDCILDYPPQLLPGVREVIGNLYNDGIKLGIVSDTGFSGGKTLRILLARAGIFDYFEEFSFSDETGVAKPHPKAFLTILNKFDCPPENALHIGDIEKTDIAGAKNLGMKAFRFTGDDSIELYRSDNPIQTIADAEITSWAQFEEDFGRINT